MADIDSTLSKLCDFGALALHRYAEVSGEQLDQLPEYFMPAYILDQIGNDIACSLETRFSKLKMRNDNIRQRRNLPMRSQKEEKDLLKLAEEIGSSRVDMVLYDGNGQGSTKDQFDFLALVEFKGWWHDKKIKMDHEKLLRILPLIDTCPHGVVCGYVFTENTHRDSKEKAQKAGDKWYSKPAQSNDEYFFCARCFSNPAAAY